MVRGLEGVLAKAFVYSVPSLNQSPSSSLLFIFYCRINKEQLDLGTESLASSSSGPTDKQSTDIDSFRAVADLDKLRQGALDAIDSFQPEGSEDKFLSNLKALHQRESKRLEDKQTTDSDLSSEERAVVDIDELRKGLPDTASLITSILGEERGRSLVAEMKKHQERHV